MRDALERLLEHLAWADGACLEALRAAPDPPRAALELFAHVIAGEALWLARLRGEGSPLEVWPEPDLADLERRAPKLRAGLRAQLDGDLTREVSYRNSAAQPFSSRADDLLLHVALHGQHHRGQVAALLRGAGAKAPSLDYIAMVRGAPTAPRSAPA